jgi:hypothetical protein
VRAYIDAAFDPTVFRRAFAGGAEEASGMAFINKYLRFVPA